MVEHWYRAPKDTHAHGYVRTACTWRKACAFSESDVWGRTLGNHPASDDDPVCAECRERDRELRLMRAGEMLKELEDAEFSLRLELDGMQRVMKGMRKLLRGER